MKLNYECKKGFRIKHTFLGMYVSYESNFSGIWFDKTDKKWKYINDIPKGHDYSNHVNVKSVKAFRRQLKKAPYGIKFVLSSRFVGHNVYGIGSSFGI